MAGTKCNAWTEACEALHSRFGRKFEKCGKVWWGINQKEPHIATRELPELWAPHHASQGSLCTKTTQKCKAIFCKSQPILKRHIFLSGNVRLWWSQDSFLLCATILPQSQMEPCKRSQLKLQLKYYGNWLVPQISCWGDKKECSPVKWYFLDDWPGNWQKFGTKKIKTHGKNYFKSCLIPICITNDSKLFHYSSVFLLLFIKHFNKELVLCVFFLFISTSYLQISDFSSEHWLHFASFHLPCKQPWSRWK